MNKEYVRLSINPFERIAGFTTLAIGVAGLFLSAVINYFTGWHAHGLLHFGPAPNLAFYCFLGEQLIIWLIPATIFYLGGLLLSSSRIRLVDVYGTTAFAMLPLVLNSFSYCLPGWMEMDNIPHNSSPLSIEITSGLMGLLMLTLLVILFIVWMFIWLWQAVKVSCNLKGSRVWVVYLVGVVGGDILSRVIISELFYS